MNNKVNVKLFITIITLFLTPIALFSSNKVGDNEKNDSSLIIIESQLNELSQKLYHTRRDDQLSMQISDSMLNILTEAYTNSNAYNYPFDSLKGMGMIESEKQEVRIFTWNIVLNTGEYKYYGFIHYNKKGIQKTFKLADNSYAIIEELTTTLSADNWYGANYYEIVERKNSQGIHYLLLGWHGHNLHLNKKVIETLYFTESGKPKFGKSLLKVQRKKYKRIIFQYSRMANMLLTYDANLDLIVMDHLSPASPVQVGEYNSYGPDLSYDALEYNGEFWEYKETIDYKRLPNKRRNR